MKPSFTVRSTSQSQLGSAPCSRRDFIQSCALGVAALASAPILGCRSAGPGKMNHSSGAPSRILSLNDRWLFGSKFIPAATAPDFDDSMYAPITLPHAVARQSWQNWNPADWQDVWSYRRHFTVPETFRGQRVFLHFDGVMVGVTPTVNGHALPAHFGGYLPFRYEITDSLRSGGNVLALAVDSRWSQVPPQGSPRGAVSVDYLELGGIHRSVRLEAVPQVFVSDVFAKPVHVLENDKRSVEVSCSLDAAAAVTEPVTVEVELRDAERVVARERRVVSIEKPGVTEVALTLTNLGEIKLWDVESPHLYGVVARLLVDGRPHHDHAARIGFREARFTLDGFFLNGRRLQLFGLNRHEVYPYVGYAMPPRVMRRDAEILRRDFNCNIVRCSHYPQSPAFLDACDELGLMVWEETPGWQYLGDAAWKRLVLRDVKDMIIRDRNRPSIIIWGTRVNESRNEVELYRETRALAKALDDSRPSSGSMTPESRKNWQKDWAEDVFAFDDYHAEPEGTVGIDDALPGVPYIIAEAVGQFNYTERKGFNSKYRRAGDIALQQAQAIRHAQAHSKAGTLPRIGGVIAWCAFDYASLVNPYNVLKCPGVADTFRIPKLGASFYLAQVDPMVRPVIAPNFYWHFGSQTPRGPGKQVAIFSNCDRLELFVNGRPHVALSPDATNYPHVKHPPFFTDLDLDGTTHPELRIDGYVGGRFVFSRSFSSDPSTDQFVMKADDAELIGDGGDATRVVFKVSDKYGAERAGGGGEVRFEVTGPGVIVGDNPFSLVDSGGVGAVWIKTKPNGSGCITVKAQHSTLGTESIRIVVRPAQSFGGSIQIHHR